MTTPQLTAERALELAEAFDKGWTNSFGKDTALILRNYAAALQECKRIAVHGCAHHRVDWANGYDQAMEDVEKILTRSPSEPHDASPSTGDSQA